MNKTTLPSINYLAGLLLSLHLLNAADPVVNINANPNNILGGGASIGDEGGFFDFLDGYTTYRNLTGNNGLRIEAPIAVAGTLYTSGELQVARGLFANTQAGSDLRLATLDFTLASGNNSRFRIHARRTSDTGGWESTPIGLSVDVDASEDAGGSIWFNSGNIGIGLATPTERLHVNGNVRCTGTLNSGGELQVARGLFGDAQTGGDLRLATYDFLINQNNSRFRIHARRTADSGGWESTPIGLTVDVDATESAGGSIWFNSGNIGVGTVLPTERLHVNGNIRCDGDLKFPSTGRVESGEEITIQTQNGKALYLNPFVNNPVIIGGPGGPANLQVLGETSTKALTITGGSDLAWNFRIETNSPTPAPGMIVRISAEQPGSLVVATNGYDRAVLGVVSGANGIKVGMRMGQDGSLASGDVPVTSTGRVWVWADATTAEIAPGDLLTSSSTPGHAMKAVDRERAFGSTVGKAMTRLESGRGMVLVWMALN